MARSDEAQTFVTGVYMAVQEIPHGKVTTYGHIARLVGKPQCPRQVGQILKHLPPAWTAETNTFHGGNVPWQRVISANGKIAKRDDPSGAGRHAEALRADGVECEELADGTFAVNLAEVGWFPKRLPSEAAEFSSSEDEEEGEPENEQ